MRALAAPPSANAIAATTAPPGCQPRSWKNRMTPTPPRNRYAKVTASTARKLIAELKAASRTCSGENSSDCGSEISGQPANTLGAHHGHSPRANDVARNCTCGKNCDLASHGIVTAPDSQGQAGSRKASAKIAIVATSGTRALAAAS